MVDSGADCALKTLLVIIHILYVFTGLGFGSLFGFLKFGLQEIIRPQLEESLRQAINSFGLDSAIKVDVTELINFIQSIIDAYAYIMMVFGGVLFALGIFGFETTLCGEKCQRVLYIIVMGIIVVAYIIAVIIFLATGEAQVNAIKKDIKKKIKENFVEIWQIIPEKPNFYALAFHSAHKQFSCIDSLLFSIEFCAFSFS